MIQALAIGAACTAAYGMFLMVRGLVRLWRNGEKKMFGWLLVFFLGLPALIVAGILLPQEKNVWITLPVVLLIICWVCAGYFLESYLRREQRRRLEGGSRIRPARPPHWRRNNLGLLIIALCVWAFGAFVGYGRLVTLNFALLCASLFVCCRSVLMLWRYRNF